MKPKALDLFCKAGGASMGLHRAGFDVVGVDIEPQPRYPFKFHQADAMTFPLEGFDFIWASPPCQRFCALATREDLSGYPDLIDPTRQRLIRTGRPFVIENVPGAPVRRDLMLCGAMFGLRSYRHRHFECSFRMIQPKHPKHVVRVHRRGENRRTHWANGGFITITGDVGTYCGPEAMGIDWMTGNEMSEAIPPVYSEFIATMGEHGILLQPELEAA
jgi:DNA (cytosine-5)-methyltransferase 1